MAQGINNPKNKEENRSDAGQMFDRAKGAASDALQKGKEAAQPLVDRASDAASMVGHKVDDATSAVGTGMKNLGDRLRSAGPQEGFLGQATHTVADTIRQGGQYLEQGGLSGMTKDVTDLIRRNPVPAVVIGLGLGFLLGRMLRS
jgi:ElaB/YqjD/DUF883 family membrane-anchored ribosome-binding protein